MSHLKKFEEVLELLINEEVDKAEEIFHQIVLEKSREIYGQLVEDFGSDMDTDYSDDIKEDEEDINADELYNDAEDTGIAADDEEAVEGEEGTVEDRLVSLEDGLEELYAKFDELTGKEEADDEEGEGSEEAEGEESDEFGEFDDEQFESLEEATKLHNDVTIDMSKEGKYAGTGAKSQAATVNTKSPIAKNGSPSIDAVKAPKFAKATGAGNQTPLSAKDTGSKEANSTATSTVKQDLGSEGKTVGTGKGAPSGKTFTKSVLNK